MVPRQITASSTVRHIGPGVSWVNDIGIMPERLSKPTVGLIPTMPLLFEGHTIEPSVSVPIAAMHRLADTATPDPELEPHGLRSITYGFFVCPPTALHPLDETLARKLAHSIRFDLAIMTAPASLSFFAMKLSLSE